MGSSRRRYSPCEQHPKAVTGGNVADNDEAKCTIFNSAGLCFAPLDLFILSRIGSGRDTLRRLNFDSTGDPRRVLPPSMGAELVVHSQDTQPQWSAGSPTSTKVVYYTEKSVTPFLSVIPKKLGDIRLRDFKVVFDRPGQYRFHFKTLDPEFGMVKEEVLHDEDIVPGWDGKIIAWVEEDI